MFIKRLVIHGFKSFPRKTEVPFTPGINVILGPNGVGKTTLLNLLIGFYDPSEGQVLFQPDKNKKPQDIHQNINEMRKQFGFASQVSSFYPKLTFHTTKPYNLLEPSGPRRVSNGGSEWDRKLVEIAE